MFTSTSKQVLLRECVAWVRDRLEGVTADGTPIRLVGLMGQMHYVAPSATCPVLPRRMDGDTRGDLLAAWAASGVLTWGDAELLLALDETTPWAAPPRRW